MSAAPKPARARQQLDRVIDRPQRQERRAGRHRAREQLERGGGDDAQRALAADVQVAQIVTSIVLAQAAQAVPELPFGGDHFQAQRQLARIAVAQHLGAAGIGGQVAAYGAAALGGQAQREQPAGIGGGLLHRLQDAAGLDRDRVVVGIDVADAVQARRRQQHRLAGVVRRGAAAQPGIAALRHHRRAMLRAQAHRLRDLGGAARPDDGLRRAAVAAPPILQVGFGVGAGQDMGGAQE
ncbi:hypothetical protein BPNSA17_07880 [Bordetella petrii]